MQNFTNNKSGLRHSDFALLEGLQNLRDKIPADFRSVVVFSSQILSRPVLNKFGWLVLPENTSEFNLPKLSLFHFLLKHHGYIICSYKEFANHFIHEKEFPENKIGWTGDIMILILLFDILMNDKKVIPPVNNLYDILPEHIEWLDKSNNKRKQLSRGSLKSSLNTAKSNPTVQNIVKNLVTLLLSKI